MGLPMRSIRTAGRLRPMLNRVPVRFLLYLCLVGALRGDGLNDPFFSDSLSYVMPTVFHQVDGRLQVYPVAAPDENPGIDGGGHPFLFFHLLALLLKLGLPPVITCHAVTVVFAALILLAVDRIGGALAGNGAGFAAVLLALANPTFLAQAGLVLLEVPQTAFTLLTLVAAIRGRWGWCAAFGSASVLTKEPAVWVLPPLGLYALMVGGRKGMIRRIACVAIPGLVFVAWMVGCKLTMGEWINRPNIRWFYVGPMLRLAELFFVDGRVVLTAALAGVVVWQILHQRRLIRLALTLMAAVCAVAGLPHLQRSVPFLGASLPWVAAALAAMLGGVGVVWRSRQLLLWGAVLMHLLMLTLLQEIMPRYALVSMALFPVLAVSALWHVPYTLIRWGVVVAGVAWAVTAWNGGATFERGLEYREVLAGTEEVTAYLERHHQHQIILWPSSAYVLTDPRYGYVSAPLDAYQHERPPRVLAAGTMPDVVVCLSAPPDMGEQQRACRTLVRILARRFEATLVETYAIDRPAIRASVSRLIPKTTNAQSPRVPQASSAERAAR